MREYRNIVAVAQNETQARALEATARWLGALAPYAQVHVIHLSQPDHDRPPLDEMLTAAWELSADLLVLGARSHQMASRVSMLAPCSVLMIPDGDDISFDRVIVPVDFSLHSAEALRVGEQLSGTTAGSSLTALAIESEDMPWNRLMDDDDSRQAEMLDALRDFCIKAIGGSRRVSYLSEPCQRGSALLHHPGLSLPHAIEGADIAATIVGVAEREGARLIVMGTRGRSRSAAMLLGSVTEKVIQFARCPVFAVKRPGESAGLLQMILERIKAASPIHTN